MQKNNLKIRYLNLSPEKFDEKDFDVVLNLEIVEHVDNIDLYLKSCQIVKRLLNVYSDFKSNFYFLYKGNY